MKIIITMIVILGAAVIIFLSSRGNITYVSKGFSLTPEKLLMSCRGDIDCESYLSINTCAVICATKDETNKKIIDNYKTTCDAALWDSYFVDCRCIKNNCQVIK